MAPKIESNPAHNAHLPPTSCSQSSNDFPDVGCVTDGIVAVGIGEFGIGAVGIVAPGVGADCVCPIGASTERTGDLISGGVGAGGTTIGGANDDGDGTIGGDGGGVAGGSASTFAAMSKCKRRSMRSKRVSICCRRSSRTAEDSELFISF